MLCDLSRHSFFSCLTLCSPYCPRTYDPLASTSHMLELLVCVTPSSYMETGVFLCAQVWMGTGMYVWVYVLMGARNFKPSFEAGSLIFWSSPIMRDWMFNELYESFCLCLPSAWSTRTCHQQCSFTDPLSPKTNFWWE